MENTASKNSQGIMSHQFHKFWLKITAIVVGSFGPIFFLGTMLASSEPARWTLDFLSWPVRWTARLCRTNHSFSVGTHRQVSIRVRSYDLVPVSMGLR